MYVYNTFQIVQSTFKKKIDIRFPVDFSENLKLFLCSQNNPNVNLQIQQETFFF